MSKPDTWMPLYIGDYRKDTSRLTTEQHGAYLLLIMDYWTNGPAPDDDAVLARICLFELRAWRKMRPIIQRFFQVQGGEWRHKRIDEEIGGAKERADKAADRARKAAEARWSAQQERTASSSPSSTAGSNAPSMHRAQLEECPSPSPSPPSDSGSNEPVSASASISVLKADVHAIWIITPQKGRERSSQADLERALRAAVKRGHAPKTVEAGVRAYYASDQATKDGGAYAKGVHRIVENDRWQAFIQTTAPVGTNSPKPDANAVDETIQRAWMQDFREAPHQWKRHERGPKPGEPGCRVRPEIQREFGATPAQTTAPFPPELFPRSAA